MKAGLWALVRFANRHAWTALRWVHAMRHLGYSQEATLERYNDLIDWLVDPGNDDPQALTKALAIMWADIYRAKALPREQRYPR